MPTFGKRSQAELDTCHPDIIRLLNRAIKEYDFSVLEGTRTKEEQTAAYESGASKLAWPKSRHNRIPSGAVDIVPYPVDWKNLHRFHDLALVIKQCAAEENIKIDWGWDLWQWDMPHWQLR